VITRQQIAEAEAARQLVEYLQVCLESDTRPTPEDLLVGGTFVFLSTETRSSRRARRRILRRFSKALSGRWPA
jgi:hypothetical protein